MQHHSSFLHIRRNGRSVLVALLAIVCLLAGSTATGAAAGPSGRAGSGPAKAKATDDPFVIHLASISPSTLSDNNAPLTITGTISNRSAEQWTTIRLYSLRSATPIIDATSLAASALVDADIFVGERIVEPGSDATVDVLEPGQTVEFAITVPRSQIAVDQAGVYWLGVQALGTSSLLPRDNLADGRARTFIPLVPKAGGKNPATVDAAIVVPIRETVWITPDGRIDRIGRWTRSLDVGGRLHTILDTAGTAEVPLTWLVDPAVLAAVARLAANNPARSIAPDPEETQPEPTEDTEGTAEDESGPGADKPDPFATFAVPIPPADPEIVPTEEESRLAELAKAWLERFTLIASSSSVLALPFGDLDASAAASRGPGYYRQAATRSTQVMGWLGIVASPALAPRDGVLNPAAITAATADSTILLSDQAFAEPPRAPQSVLRLLEHRVVVTSSGAAAGGPSPTAADDPLALRQRLLSEAALRLQSGSRSPVVLMLPADWQPTDPSGLATELDVSWLNPLTVGDLSDERAVAVESSALDYTAEDESAELDLFNFSAADQLGATAAVLDDVLTLPNPLLPQVGDEVLMSLSEGHRTDTGEAATSARGASDFLSAQLAQVTVDAPGRVTLSSETGNLGAEVVNGLDQPVTVDITLDSDGSMTMEELEPISISAGSRRRILPSVKANRPGIHQARLVVTDTNGTPLGQSDGMQIRAAEVSGLIWLLLAGGALLLFGTIAVRLVRRIRDRKKSES